MSLLGNLLTSVGGLLTNAFLIFLTAIFILLEASSFPTKIRLNISSAEATLSGFREFATRLNKYVVIKSAMSLATGITVATWTWICGLQFWLLWGLLAFLLNYIPNLGSILAAVPAIVLALLKDGPVAALVVAVGYLAINMTLSSLLEPRFLGRGLGLSTLVVFVSLVVWAWILGPIGVLLAVPLTMTVKIALSSNERTQWIAALLGPEIGESIDGTVSEHGWRETRAEKNAEADERYTRRTRGSRRWEGFPRGAGKGTAGGSGPFLARLPLNARNLNAGFRSTSAHPACCHTGADTARCCRAGPGRPCGHPGRDPESPSGHSGRPGFRPFVPEIPSAIRSSAMLAKVIATRWSMESGSPLRRS